MRAVKVSEPESTGTSMSVPVSSPLHLRSAWLYGVMSARNTTEE